MKRKKTIGQVLKITFGMVLCSILIIIGSGHTAVLGPSYLHDSFFDVFTELNLPPSPPPQQGPRFGDGILGSRLPPHATPPDSFFDVFTEVTPPPPPPIHDSFFDVFTEVTPPPPPPIHDSFFDVFVEID